MSAVSDAMKTVIFDGVEYAARLQRRVAQQAERIAWDRGRKLKLVAILNPDIRSAKVYTGIKMRRAHEMGIEFERIEVLGYRIRSDVEEIIEQLNKDATVDGILVQLPLGSGDDQKVCDRIVPEKDVDGEGKGSRFVPAAVKAILAILEEAKGSFDFAQDDMGKVLVVGNKGMVGRRVQKELKCAGMDKDDFDTEALKQADVIIACTGQESLITGDLVKDGVVIIDVGWPKGDVEYASVLPKASFITPVPGGVGPVTVMKLFENLVDSVG